jgi:hypothetical protein
VDDLSASNIRKKEGTERFSGNDDLSFTLTDFWRWSASDLLSNTQRGILAEFLVANALSAPQECRIEWDLYDVLSPKGLRIEVKSAAYLQSWGQKRFSSIVFSIAESRAWDREQNIYAQEVKRQADVYVFCLLHHRQKQTVNPMDVSQWSFYVIETETLNKKCASRKTISLASLLKIEPRCCTYDELGGVLKELENALL